MAMRRCEKSVSLFFILQAQLLFAEPLPPSVASNGLASNILQQVLASSIPPSYEKRDNWGKTVMVYDGIQVERGKNGLPEYRKHKSPAPHGLWKRYVVTIPDPARCVRAEILHITAPENKSVNFAVRVTVDFDVYVELKSYSNGFKLLSVAAEAEGQVVMELDCVATLKPTGLPILPDIEIEPTVTDTRLSLPHFRLKRIGKVKGDLAKEIGDGIRGAIRDRVREEGPRVAREANRAIAKAAKEGKLTISPAKGIADSIPTFGAN
jgi:hypothetical protein